MVRTLTVQVFSAGVACINVGPDAIPFDAHIELLCDVSLYFDNLFAGRFSTKPLEPLNLPHVDPQTFADFLAFVYQGTLKGALVKPSWLRLCRLWILAGELKVYELQKHVVHWWKIKSDEKDEKDEKIDEKTIRVLYDSTIECTDMKVLLLQTWKERAQKQQFDGMRSQLPRQFLEDLCRDLLLGSSHSSEHSQDGFVDSKSTNSGDPIPKPRVISPQTGENLTQPASTNQMAARIIRTPKGRLSPCRDGLIDSTPSPKMPLSVETKKDQT